MPATCSDPGPSMLDCLVYGCCTRVFPHLVVARRALTILLRSFPSVANAGVIEWQQPSLPLTRGVAIPTCVRLISHMNAQL